MSNLHYILVYGSLRRTSSRGFNFDRFGVGSQRYIRTINVAGFDLRDLGAYPAATLGKGAIKCELHEVDDKTYQSLARMEAGAGYDELTINLPEGAATIFTYDADKLIGCPKVASGDWE